MNPAGVIPNRAYARRPFYMRADVGAGLETNDTPGGRRGQR